MLKNAKGRFLQSHELMPLLGFTYGQHLPKEGFPPRELQGVMFKCLPAKPLRKGHRLLVLCGCGRWMPFGRMGQHAKACIWPRLSPGARAQLLQGRTSF